MTSARDPDSQQSRLKPSDKNDPREIFGWKMYDWANSAFYTTVVGALFSPYITRLAQDAVGKNGTVLDLGFLGAVTAESFPTLCVSISVGAQVVLLPILGALGDYSNLKKRLMALFCYTAVVANALLFFISGNLYLLGGLLFNDYVGIGPKWVINRYRLHEAIERMAEGGAVDWAQLALELGYFDQAHFIRDFKALVGRPPAEYARTPE